MAQQKKAFCSAKALQNLKKDNIFVQKLEKWRRNKDYISTGKKSDGSVDTGTAPNQRLADILREGISSSGETAELNEFILGIGYVLSKVKKDVSELMTEYLPPSIQDSLKPLLGSTVIIGMLELFKQWKEIELANENKEIFSREEFEILRTIELVRKYFLIGAKYKDWKTPLREWQKQDEEQEEAIKTYLVSKGIFSNIKKEKWFIFYDPLNQWKCVSMISSEDFLNGKNIPANMCYEAEDVEIVTLNIDDSSEKKVKALLASRKKGYMSTIGRMLRNKELNPEFLPDRYGIRLAYFSLEDMKRGEEFVQKKLWEITEGVKNVPSLNKFSAKNLIIESQFAFIDGKYREIQHLPVEHLYNICNSIAPENHTLYHARWYAAKNGLFSQLFPKELFGINWNKKKVQEQIFSYIKQRFEERNKKFKPAPPSSAELASF
ncbi:MAG: hypothetical protein PHD51_01430 [Patescibacteria group bacterium]|nr:hypothetical protein [Patescibacteria group bacterium]MDD5490477.1 hypothetical protein [Patescibacteria group bacterium]